MASIFKKDRRRKGAPYYIDYFDENGVRQREKGCPDRAATEQIARKLEADVALRRRGILDPKAEARRDHQARPMADHLAAFREALLARGNTAKHVDLCIDRTSRVFALVVGADLSEIEAPRTATKAARAQADARLAKVLGAARLSDLTADAVQAALATLKDAGRSLGTCNHHRAAVRAFSRWAKRSGRTADDILESVTGFNAEEDRRHDRRTIGIDELRRLIEVAERGAPYRQMSGPARALCYRLAAATGLRLSEIKSITPHSIDFQASPATVTVAAGYTKNGERATLSLPDDVATDLQAWVAHLPAKNPVFRLPDRGASMLKIDLKAAGIPYRDAEGLVFDFHSLRCQTATLADQAGCSPRVVQRLMRHSKLELTGRYTRPRDVDLAAATRALPTLRSRQPGTDPVLTAAASATAAEDDEPNPFSNNALASSDTRNHNPRVGGSSPSAATK
jgi:integrase